MNYSWCRLLVNCFANRPEVTLCGWQNVKIKLVTKCLFTQVHSTAAKRHTVLLLLPSILGMMGETGEQPGWSGEGYNHTERDTKPCKITKTRNVYSGFSRRMLFVTVVVNIKTHERLERMQHKSQKQPFWPAAFWSCFGNWQPISAHQSAFAQRLSVDSDNCL